MSEDTNGAATLKSRAPAGAPWSGKFDDDLTSSQESVDRAVTLPPYCYSSEDFYRFEQEAVFTGGWFCLGRESAIPEAGDYFTAEVAGEPLIVVRDGDDAINVLSAVCRHRSAVMLEGRGNCGPSLRCPYHSWNYAFDGRLRGAPQMSQTVDFDKDGIRLPRLAVDTWGGFVFASFEQPAVGLSEMWSEFGDFVTNYGLADLHGPAPEVWDLDWNWKTMLENATECYHCTAVHGELHGTAPTRNTIPSPLGYEAQAFVLRVRNTGIDTDFNPSGKALLPAIESLSIEERTHSTWAILPPNLFLSLQHDNAHYFLLHPRGPKSTWMEVGYLYPESTLALPEFEAKYGEAMEGWVPIMEQDAEINRLVARGLRSRFAGRGRYSWQEEPIAYFGRWLSERYETHWLKSRQG